VPSQYNSPTRFLSWSWGENGYAPFFRSELLTQSEVEILAEALENWILSTDGIDEEGVGTRICIEPSANENTARFIEMEAEWQHYLKNLIPYNRRDQWEEKHKELFEKAEEFKNHILSLKPFGVSTHFLLVDAGGGPDVFACVNTLTEEQFSILYDVLSGQLYEEGFVLSCCSEDEAHDNPSLYVRCRFQWKEIEEDPEVFLSEVGKNSASICEQILDEIEAFSELPPPIPTDDENQIEDDGGELEDFDENHGEESQPNGQSSGMKDVLQPTWDKALSQLLFDDEVVRKVSPQAANLIKILDAFQEDGWPKKIDSPFSPCEDGKQKRSDAIRELNKKLRKIRFESDGSGEGLLWKLADDELPQTSHKTP